nr:CoA transferase [Cupriavidus basilensis]
MSGKTILDLTRVLGGPFAGQLLAQLGAEVIKIEPIDGDFARSVPPLSDTQDSAFFLSVNSGKRSVALDLKTPEGKEAFYALVRTADAVIYGFAPDVPSRLGLDSPFLKAINPRIAVAQIVGLDDKGAYAKAPAFDLVLQAMAGVMGITGDEGGRPVRVGYQVADLAGGLYLALATVAAMLKAECTDVGEHVQLSLFDAQIAMLSWQAQGFLSFGKKPSALGARHAMIAPSDAYPTADGRYIAVAPTGEAFWQKFCTAIGRAGLIDDPRFANASARIQYVEELTAELSSTMRTRPAAVIKRVDEALARPLIEARSMVETAASRSGDKSARLLGNPFKHAGAAPLSYPPALGEDTFAVLTEQAGYNASDIERMETAGAIRTARAES